MYMEQIGGVETAASTTWHSAHKTSQLDEVGRMQEESLCEDTNWGEGEGGSDVPEGIRAP